MDRQLVRSLPGIYPFVCPVLSNSLLVLFLPAHASPIFLWVTFDCDIDAKWHRKWRILHPGHIKKFSEVFPKIENVFIIFIYHSLMLLYLPPLVPAATGTVNNTSGCRWKGVKYLPVTLIPSMPMDAPAVQETWIQSGVSRRQILTSPRNCVGS